MIAWISLVLNLLAAFLKSKSRLEAENAALRQQLIVLQRKVRGRIQFDNGDRLFFVRLYRWFPSVREAMLIIRPHLNRRFGRRAGWRAVNFTPALRALAHPRLEADEFLLSLGSRADQ